MNDNNLWKYCFLKNNLSSKCWTSTCTTILLSMRSYPKGPFWARKSPFLNYPEKWKIQSWLHKYTHDCQQNSPNYSYLILIKNWYYKIKIARYWCFPAPTHLVEINSSSSDFCRTLRNWSFEWGVLEEGDIYNKQGRGSPAQCVIMYNSNSQPCTPRENDLDKMTAK